MIGVQTGSSVFPCCYINCSSPVQRSINVHFIFCLMFVFPVLNEWLITGRSCQHLYYISFLKWKETFKNQSFLYCSPYAHLCSSLFISTHYHSTYSCCGLLGLLLCCINSMYIVYRAYRGGLVIFLTNCWIK